jgi:3'-5' exoribonuclease
VKEGIWVADIAANRALSGLYLAKEKKLLAGKTGKPYLLVRLMDKTGETEARIWDRAEEMSVLFQPGDLIQIAGDAISYQGTLQVRIRALKKVKPIDDGCLPEFVPGYHEANEASLDRHAELLRIVEDIKSPWLRQLVVELLTDADLKEKWLSAPAAKRLHHARFGGLLEHTLALCRLCLKTCELYPRLRKDLLLAGAVLHDIGKLTELCSPWAPEYTTEGRLLGHLVIGVRMLEERMAKISDVREEEALELKHLILSHHGLMEYGSPRRPKTLEALVLHMLDDLDAKYDAFHTHLSGGDEEWTTYHPLFERYLYRGRTAPQDIEDAD